MAPILIDIIYSLFQAALFSMTIMNCLESKKSDFRTILTCIFIFIANFSFTTIIGNFSVCIFLAHISSMCLLGVIYNKSKIESIVSYTLMYCLMDLYTIIFGIVFLGNLKNLILIEYTEIVHKFIGIMPFIVFGIIYFKYMYVIIESYKLIINEKQSAIVLIITSFVLDFIISFYSIVDRNETILLKSIIIIALCIFLIGITAYFIRIKKNADEIFKLNEVLSNKNSELKKIKDKYMKEVSYMYGLHRMNKWDELGKALKKIINNNSSIKDDEEYIESKNLILALSLKQARDKGVHIILEEKCDIALANMNEMELYRVISNIINNAVKAMNGIGIIIVKTYCELENVIVRIENNGPKIPENIINDIFKVGFTTKKNTDGSHGYGLSIVKELVETYDGKILVRSNDISTEFEINLPIKIK